MRRVPVDQVKNYMFGYMNTNDISDRQGRGTDEWAGDRFLRAKGKTARNPSARSSSRRSSWIP